MQASDLLSPSGEVEPEFFPNDSTSALHSRLDAYIAEGEGKAGAGNPEAVRSWALYRVYDAVFTRLSTDPSSASFDAEGSASWSADQRRAIAKKRDGYLAAFRAAVSTAPRRAHTKALDTEIRW